MMTEWFFEKKNVFIHLLKNLLYKNGGAENMPVIAGRLAVNHDCILMKNYHVFCQNSTLNNF